mmetsp:Transcript_16661/g.32196  ORF Transcript_16661/g.32196 Transcript_16661/m.32196 type:complete len:650 (+) Transcript_16661:40-1989(+)
MSRNRTPASVRRSALRVSRQDRARYTNDISDSSEDESQISGSLTRPRNKAPATAPPLKGSTSHEGDIPERSASVSSAKTPVDKEQIPEPPCTPGGSAEKQNGPKPLNLASWFAEGYSAFGDEDQAAHSPTAAPLAVTPAPTTTDPPTSSPPAAGCGSVDVLHASRSPHAIVESAPTTTSMSQRKSPSASSPSPTEPVTNGSKGDDRQYSDTVEQLRSKVAHLEARLRAASAPAQAESGTALDTADKQNEKGLEETGLDAREREKIAKEAAASAVAAMQSELQHANEFGEECAQRIATLEARAKHLKSEANAAREHSKNLERMSRGHMVKVESAAASKLAAVESKLAAQSRALEEALLRDGQLQDQVREARAEKAAAQERLGRLETAMKGHMVKVEAQAASKVQAAESKLATRAEELQALQAKCALLEEEAARLKSAASAHMEQMRVAEKVAAGHRVRTEAQAEHKLAGAQAELLEQNRKREAAEQRMHELELEFSATKAEAAAARERARQADNICRGAIVKTESQARGRVEIEVSARKAAEARVAELEAVAKTLQERVDAHSTKMSSTPTAEASHRNAIALEQQLSSLLANAWLVLCWRGTDHGQVYGRALTLNRTLKKMVGLLAFAAFLGTTVHGVRRVARATSAARP